MNWRCYIGWHCYHFNLRLPDFTDQVCYGSCKVPTTRIWQETKCVCCRCSKIQLQRRPKRTEENLI
jgi:hypothetical protein